MQGVIVDFCLLLLILKPEMTQTHGYVSQQHSSQQWRSEAAAFKAHENTVILLKSLKSDADCVLVDLISAHTHTQKTK